MSAVKIPHRRPERSGNNSTIGEKLAENFRSAVAQFFGGRRVIVVAGVLAGLVVIAAAILWYFNIYANPSHTFWDMVGNNLSTNSVTRQTTQKNSSITSTETNQLSFSPSPMVRDIKEINSSAKSASSDIKIESLGTTTSTYQHYIWIRRSDGKSGQLDYSKVYPLWIKNSGAGQSARSTLFDDTLFRSSAFLFGNMPAEQKSKVKADLDSAYNVDFSNVKTQKIHGRKVFVYNVGLSLYNYAKAAQIYAKDLGLSEASQINPANYQTSDQISMTVSVDVLSRQLRQVTYASSSTSEEYSGYGIFARFKLPTHTVSYSTLQKAVDQVSGAKTK